MDKDLHLGFLISPAMQNALLMKIHYPKPLEIENIFEVRPSIRLLAKSSGLKFKFKKMTN